MEDGGDIEDKGDMEDGGDMEDVEDTGENVALNWFHRENELEWAYLVYFEVNSDGAEPERGG